MPVHNFQPGWFPCWAVMGWVGGTRIVWFQKSSIRRVPDKNKQTKKPVNQKTVVAPPGFNYIVGPSASQWLDIIIVIAVAVSHTIVATSTIPVMLDSVPGQELTSVRKWTTGGAGQRAEEGVKKEWVHISRRGSRREKRPHSSDSASHLALHARREKKFCNSL